MINPLSSYTQATSELSVRNPEPPVRGTPTPPRLGARMTPPPPPKGKRTSPPPAGAHPVADDRVDISSAGQTASQG